MKWHLGTWILVHQTKYLHTANQIYFTQTVFIWSSLPYKSTEDPTEQSSLQVFLLCLNQNYSQTFKSSSCKQNFLQCVCYKCNLLRWIFLFQVITGSLSLLWHYFNRHVIVFFERSVWKKSVFYFISTITNTVLTPKSQNKVIVYYTY